MVLTFNAGPILQPPEDANEVRRCRNMQGQGREGA